MKKDELKPHINGKKFGGKYVATPSFTNWKVIASGKNLLKVHERAIKKGIKDPVIIYVPKEDEAQMF